ncbi:cysteine proteinase [Auriculariales sp. MPI-PUGE-AT-0066]|nr:cysteine proteinase [Auriculariales sp. MPI-PUGE-AT-0066]
MSADNAASTSAAAAHEDSLQPHEIPPSVHQVDAWEQKHLPRLQYDTLDHAVFRWSLADWSWDRLEKRRQKLFSPEFKCGGHNWKLMLFLGGVVASDPGKVSIYLVCTSTAKENHPCAQMAFSMSNPNDPTVYLTYNSYHRFTPHDDDWGFTYFCSSERLRTESASGRAVLEDDHVVVSVFMRVVKDSTAGGVLWYNLGTGCVSPAGSAPSCFAWSKRADNRRSLIHMSLASLTANAISLSFPWTTTTRWCLSCSYCPRATTGLMNMSAPTFGVGCLNLALQLLNMIAPFRMAVYSIPTIKNDRRTAVPYALQRLFYELQNSSMPVSQTDLIAAMGWSDAWLRRARWDVMDYIRPILAALEEHLESTPYEHAIQDMFYGQTEAYLAGVAGGSHSAEMAPFDALDLDVQGYPDIVRALRASREPLVMPLPTDSNGFSHDYGHASCEPSTSDLSRQPQPPRDCALGTRLRALPPVLVLNLRRWRWDAAGQSPTKCEDRCEYPLELNLREFVRPGTAAGPPELDHLAKYDYVLHAVFLDDGHADGGSYTALIKPRPDAFWCKFDDQTIIPVEDGSVREPYEGPGAAYALVYLRRDRAKEFLAPLEESVVPPQIRELRCEWGTDAEEDGPIQVRLVGKSEFKRHMGFDIAGAGEAQRFEARRDETLRDILPRIRKMYKRAVQIRAMVKRHNRAVRPSKIVPFQGATLDMTLREIGTTYNNFMDETYLLFYVEETADMRREKPFDKTKRLIFLKHFDIPNESLRGVGAVYVNPHDQVGAIRDRIRKIMHWRNSVDVEMLEEVMCDVPQHIDIRKTFLQSNFETGDVIAFNRRYVPPPESAADASGETSAPRAPKYPTLLSMMRSFERPAA